MEVLLTPAKVKDNSIRPSGTMTPKSVTIHNTANPNAGAEKHAKAQAAGNFYENKIAVHYYVDDKVTYKCLEDTWQGWHAGDGKGPGNTSSIGIEVCEQTGIDQKKAFINAAELAASLVKKYGLTVNEVVPHRKWSGKYCPHILLDGKNGLTWDWFTGVVASKLKPAALAEEVKEEIMDNTPAQWEKEGVEWAIGIGLIKGDGNGNLKLHRNITLAELCVILKRASEVFENPKT